MRAACRNSLCTVHCRSGCGWKTSEHQNVKGSPHLCGEPLDKLQPGYSRATTGRQPDGCAIRFALFSAFVLDLVLALTLALMAPDSGDKLMQLDRKSLEIRLGVLGVCPHQGALSGKALVDH